MLEITIIQLIVSFLLGVATGKLLPDEPPAWSNKAIKYCAIDKLDENAKMTPAQAIKECTDESGYGQ